MNIYELSLCVIVNIIKSSHVHYILYPGVPPKGPRDENRFVNYAPRVESQLYLMTQVTMCNRHFEINH